MAFSEFIGEVRALQRRPKNDEALQLLKCIASIVKPIMKKRNWKVVTLSEFFPNNPNLLGLNVNRGREIKIRLRPHSDESRFLHFESLVGTMLHEYVLPPSRIRKPAPTDPHFTRLTHIIHGPHDAKFYSLLDTLTKEYDSNLAAGYRGEGFEGPGSRVGQNHSHYLPPHLARAAAVSAAEKRRKTNELMTPSGGRKLGGAADSRVLERVLRPGELAAVAAERRAARDKIWCGSGEEVEGGGGSAAGVLGVDVGKDGVVVVSGKSKPSVAAPTGKVDSKAIPVVIDAGGIASGGHLRTPHNNTSHANSSSDTRKRKFSSCSDHTWTCPSCTLINAPFALQCDCCWTERPHNQSPEVDIDLTLEDAGPSRSGSPQNPSDLNRRQSDADEVWMCPQCTLMNDAKFRMCSVCEYLRPV
ncbi:hypothetical protein HK097_011324 [Rhizophlyctis rosea]|uniref:RanBP2-type domain-containing protein n=1 Tax=Rhizophlyctis rosea TaxID=64517 RepID=A0AAD5SNY0_9FUNG|nr:hypothetical protein HK097_011324 [Rhizophlyctis rosea]